MIHLSVKFGWVEGCLDAFRRKKNRQVYGKLEKLTEHLLTKRHPSNLVNTIFYLVFQCFDSQIGWVDGRLEVVRGENNTDK